MGVESILKAIYRACYMLKGMETVIRESLIDKLTFAYTSERNEEESHADI